MRQLNSQDVFVALRLVKRLNLKTELKNLVEYVRSASDNEEEAGVLGIIQILEFVSEKQCETAFYEFLSGPFQCTPEDISIMNLQTLIDNLLSLAKENDLKRFFTSLWKLTKQKL